MNRAVDTIGRLLLARQPAPWADAQALAAILNGVRDEEALVKGHQAEADALRLLLHIHKLTRTREDTPAQWKAAMFGLAKEARQSTLPALLRIARQVANGQVRLTEEDRVLVQQEANERGGLETLLVPYTTETGDEATRVAYMLHVFRELHTAVARGIVALLTGQVRLLRCPAPAKDSKHEHDLCGRYFVSGGRKGQPARYCSDTCRKRAHRWAAKRAGTWRG